MGGGLGAVRLHQFAKDVPLGLPEVSAILHIAFGGGGPCAGIGQAFKGGGFGWVAFQPDHNPVGRTLAGGALLNGCHVRPCFLIVEGRLEQRAIKRNNGL